MKKKYYFNLFLLCSIIAFIMISMFFNKKSSVSIDYKIIEQKDYDTPTKSQYSLRVTVPVNTTKDTLGFLAEKLFNEALNRPYKYHTKPTHIFIYIYSDTVNDYQGNWDAMISRIMDENKGIQFKN